MPVQGMARSGTRRRAGDLAFVSPGGRTSWLDISVTGPTAEVLDQLRLLTAEPGSRRDVGRLAANVAMARKMNEESANIRAVREAGGLWQPLAMGVNGAIHPVSSRNLSGLALRAAAAAPVKDALGEMPLRKKLFRAVSTTLFAAYAIAAANTGSLARAGTAGESGACAASPPPQGETLAGTRARNASWETLGRWFPCRATRV